ncbi:MAG: AMP-binding protein [Pseudomonadota bacterium]
MADHYDRLETQSDYVRSAFQFEKLRELLGAIAGRAPGLDNVAIPSVTDRAALAQLPILRKSALTDLQAANPPFGGLTTKPPSEFDHIFMSPGPIFEPGSMAPDWWRFARAFHALGVRKGDVLQNCFAYHLTPAGMMMESGARALGCTVVPGGIGATEQQAQAMSITRATGYAGTPDYLKVILEKGDELGLDLRSVSMALVSGGALFPSLRQDYADRGILCLQCYATADLGLIAYETQRDGEPLEGMIVDEGVILEIVRPGTGDPVADGEVGEVVVTSLNPDYPLIRFATGDLSAVLPGESACGRTGLRIKGWMGRADQRTKIKGMFVDTPQVDAVVKRHPEIAKARVVVAREGEQDVFVVKVESDAADPEFTSQVSETVASVFKVRGQVEAVASGALPNDGKVIEDTREYGA